jgi:hypothetical protein
VRVYSNDTTRDVGIENQYIQNQAIEMNRKHLPNGAVVRRRIDGAYTKWAGWIDG